MKKSNLPLYVTEFKDRHGTWRTRFRRKGFQAYYFQNKTGSTEWQMEYKRCLQGAIPRTEKTIRVPPGSIGALVAIYYQTPEFKSLRDSTKSTYRGILRRFNDKHGTKIVSRVERKHIRAILANMSDTPGAANKLLDRLRILFVLALDLGWITQDPTHRVKGYKLKPGGFPDWSDAEVTQYEQHYPIGTKERLALDLLLYTGQRRSDVVRMGRQHVKNSHIRVVQLKTGSELEIPIIPPLAASLAAIQHDQLTFLITEYGAPFTANGFGGWFRRVCDRAGINGRSAHGLRKVAARRLAEAGSSNAEIKSITGHRTDKEVQRYTESASQLKLADSAMKKVYQNKE